MNRTLKPTWHVLYVKPRHEKKVAQCLKQKKLITFLPLIKVIRKWSDRKKTVEVPLFPSYIFVKINTSLDFHSVLSLDSTCDFIRFGNTYAKATDEEINNIKLLLNLDGIENIKTSSQKFQSGGNYKIDYGPLRGLKCQIVRVNNKDEIMVRVDSIQQNITVTLSKHYLSELVMA